MKKIVCFHLFNDYSGSPKVLRTVLGGLAARGMRIDLLTSKGEGALSDLGACAGVRMSTYAYRFSDNGAVTLVRYAAVQLYTFCRALRYVRDRDAVFYVNTILPVGAALAGRLMGKRVVYHYHENAFAKGTFYKLLARAMERLASEVVCVSDYQRSFLKRQQGVRVIPNALPEAFAARLCPDPTGAFDRKRVLMLGSLKRYKGTAEFIELARSLPEYAFELVLNEEAEPIEAFRKTCGAWPENLTVHARQRDVAPFYNRASVVLNLTDKHQAIETFGLTALEAMTAGLPVVVPTVGGIAELVDDGVNGYKIDVQELEKVAGAVRGLLSDRERYVAMAEQALCTAARYSAESMCRQFAQLLEGG